MTPLSHTDTGCVHETWAVESGVTPLHCEACGEIWPGAPLPRPEGRNEGYGELAELASWRSRVDAMVGELREVV